jgi:oxygen-independent coproporphyrinogen-3 oxidase
MKPHQKALTDRGIAGDWERLAMESNVRSVLNGAGYGDIGMDHFARADDELTRAQHEKRMRRNFQGYTCDQARTMLAFGASAIGQTMDGFAQNQKETRNYQMTLADGHLPIIRGYRTTEEDRLRADIIEQLMCYFECDVAIIAKRHGKKPEMFRTEFETLRAFVSADLVRLDGWIIKMISPYRQAIRSIAAVFDAHAPKGNAIYSRVA